MNANLDNQSNRGLRDKTVKCYRERLSEPADTLGKVLMSEPKADSALSVSAGGFKRGNLFFFWWENDRTDHMLRQRCIYVQRVLVMERRCSRW